MRGEGGAGKGVISCLTSETFLKRVLEVTKGYNEVRKVKRPVKWFNEESCVATEGDIKILESIPDS